MQILAYIGIFLLLLIIIALNYLIITNFVDVILLGKISLRTKNSKYSSQYFIKYLNRIDIQIGFQCSAYASAYILRCLGIEISGTELYPLIPHKMKNGYVYPKGVKKILQNYGLNVRYCRGNLDSLKTDLEKGYLIILMIRVRKDKSWLHYVPLVGYDENYLYLAESLRELINHNGNKFNRKLSSKEFLLLWDTKMIKQPFYKNTYFIIDCNSKGEI